MKIISFALTPFLFVIHLIFTGIHSSNGLVYGIIASLILHSSVRSVEKQSGCLCGSLKEYRFRTIDNSQCRTALFVRHRFSKWIVRDQHPKQFILQRNAFW